MAAFDESPIPESERVLAQLDQIRRAIASNANRLAETGRWPEHISPESILGRIPANATDVAAGFDAGVACTLDLIPREKQLLSARLHANYDKDAVEQIRREAEVLDADSETAWWLAACFVCGTEERADGVKFLDQVARFRVLASDAEKRLQAAQRAIETIRSSVTFKDGVPFGTVDGCIQGAYVAGYSFGGMYAVSDDLYFIGTYEPTLGLEDFLWSDETDKKGRAKSGPVSGSRQFVKCANEDEYQRAVAIVKKNLTPNP